MPIHMPFVWLALVIFLTACSDVDNSIPPAELTEYKQEINLKTNWGHSLGGGIDPYHKIDATVLGDHLYTVSAEGLISKINVLTGAIEWQKNTQTKTYAGLAVSDTKIVLVSSEGLVNTYKNDPELPIVWQKRVKSELNVQPIIEDNRLFVRLSNGNLNAYDIETGKKYWTVSRRVPELSLTGSSKPSVFNDLVYSGFDDGHLVAYEKNNGDMVWDKSVSVPSGRSELDRMVDLDGQFIIKNNIIYISGFQGRLSAIQTQDGTELWSRPMSSVKKLSLDDQAIYVSDQQSHLWAIDRRTGAALWKQESLHHRDLTSMSLINDLAVVADFEGYAHWLNKQTGQLMARQSIASNKITSPPIVYNNQILFLDISNQLTSVSVVK